MREPTDLEKSYVAGVLDGEGCIRIIKNENFDKITVNVSNTKPILVNFLQEIYGGSISIIESKSTLSCSEGKMRKPVFCWNVFASDAEKILKDTRPFLLIKAEQADIALLLRKIVKEQKEFFSCANGLPEEFKVPRFTLFSKMKELNAKGVLKN